MGIEYFDFNITSGTNRAIDCKADFVRYMAGSAGGADESIIVKSAQGGIEAKLKPGQSFKISAPQTRWYIQGVSGNAVIGEILFAEGGTLDDSTVAGTVNVIDGAKYRTLSDTAFILPRECGGGNYPHVQLWNPTATKNIVLEKIFVSSTNMAAQIHLHAVTSALDSPNLGQNKKLKGVNSVMETRIRNNLTAIIGDLIFVGQVETGKITTIEFKEPLIIGPSIGLTILAYVNNLVLDCNFEYYEQVI